MKPLFPAIRCVPGVLLLSLARLNADAPPPTPGLTTTTGLAGQQSSLSWTAEPGVRYRVEKSTGLTSDGAGAWSTRAIVEATSPSAKWVDPEAQSSRAFYRVPQPPPEVFQVQPPVLSSGGILWLDAQCLPAGCSAVFEIEGIAPVSAPVIKGPDGRYTITLPPLPPSAEGARVISARLVDGSGVTVVTIAQQLEITPTGLSSNPGPVLPPIVAAIQKNKTRSNQSNDRLMPDEDCDGIAGDTREDCDDTDTSPRDDSRSFPKSSAVLRPRMALGAVPMASRSKRSEAELNLNAIEKSSHRPGAVSLQQCDLSLATPAGPAMEWTRTYTSRPSSTGADAPAQFDFAWNARIVPVPLAAGTSAPRIYLFGGDGRRDVLVRQPDGSYTCDGMFRSGRFNADTSFTLTFADQTKMIFCPLVGAPWTGRLGSLVDSNGVAVSCTYTAGGQLNTVSSQFGQSFTCTYGTDGRLSKVTDHTGRFVSYAYYNAGETGGNPGDLKSVSCVQKPGEAPVAGPTTYTYTSGNADDALNHNLLTVTDGSSRLCASFTYSPQANPRAIDYDVCIATDFDGSGPGASPPTVYSYQPVSGSAYPGSYRVTCNDTSGRVSEFTYSASHDCIACRQYTGFSLPGVPVTDTTNRPTGKLRAGDPDFFETTWLYNGQHLCTRETLPDGTQLRYSHECDLNPACPVIERANARVITLRSPDGEERTITCDYLSGFGTTEGVWAGEDGKGGCTERRIPIRNLGSSGEDGVAFARSKHRGWDGLIYHRAAYLSKKSYDYYSALATETTGRAGGTGTSAGGIGPDPVLCSNPIPGVGVVVKRNIVPKHKRVAGGGGSVWPGEDGDGGCTDGPDMMARGTNPDGSDCTNKGRPKLGSAMLSSGHVIPIGCGGGSGIGGDLRPGQPIGGLSIKGGRNHPTRISTSLGQVFTWTYDAAGNCLTERTPVAGAGCDATYNSLGQCTSLTVLNGAGSSFTQTCSYHPVTKWLSSHVMDPAGLHITTSFEADAVGRVTRCVDPLGNDWLTEYNALDCVTRTRSATVNSSRIACDYFYDTAGELSRFDIEHRDETGALVASNPAYTVFLQRDNRGRLMRVACEQRPVDVPVLPPVLTPDGLGLSNFAVEDYTYNANGECVRVSTPAECRGQTEDSACDFQYDERGLIYRCIEGGAGGSSSVTTQTDYDSTGAVIRISLLPSSSAGAAGEPLTSSFTWDGFHRLRTCTCPMGNVYTYDYDSSGGVTCSLTGEVNDEPGQAGNVLLARGQTSAIPMFLVHGAARTLPLAGLGTFCRCTPGYTQTQERFAAGEAGPYPTEVTSYTFSPAGLLLSISCNGDTLITNSYDSAARMASTTSTPGSFSCVRDACGDIISYTRTDVSTNGALPPKSYTTTCTRDTIGRIITRSDGTGNTASFAYDSRNRIKRCTTPQGTTYRCQWDGNYNDGTGTVSPYTLLVEADPTGSGQYQMLRYCTCPMGYSIKTVNSYGDVCSVTLDPLNRPTAFNYADGTHEFQFTDAYGRFTMCLHRDNTMSVSELDGNGRVTRMSMFGTPAAIPVAPVEYTYTGRGLPTAITQGDSHITCAWDSLGNQLSEKHNGYGVTRSFNHRGRTGVAYSDGTRFAESRDAHGRILTVSAVNSAGIVLSPPVTVMQYQGLNQASETRRNGVTTTWEYRGDGDAPLPGGGEDYSFDACVRTVCTASNGTVLYSTRVRRDHNQCVTVADSFFASGATAPGRRHTQTWDRLGRLTGCTIQRREVAGGPLVVESAVTYTLDLEGRRLTATGGSYPGAYIQNAASPPADRQAGQYSQWPQGALAWDDAGCLLSMAGSTGGRDFVYDAASRLVAVNDSATGTAVATYAYDAVGRRTRSSTDGGAGLPPVTTYFVYDGPRCIQELGGDNLPNVTMPDAETGGFAICISSRNGTLVYPHGGGGGSGGGSTAKWNYPILHAEMCTLKEMEVEDPVLEFIVAGGGGGAGHGGGGAGGLLGASLKKFDWAPKLEGGKEGLRSSTAVLGVACTAGPGGNVAERLDGSESGQPIFLTSDGLPRAGATGTLSGCDWFTRPESCNLIWSPRSNVELYGRYCPESGFLQCAEGVYSPQLGMEASTHKSRFSDNMRWDLKANKK